LSAEEVAAVGHEGVQHYRPWKKMLRGSAVEVLGHGAGQLLRFFSNLVLARLLFPEAFGLGALVVTVNQGLIMLSDLGIEPAVIQHKRGGERAFLNTAFTIQATRGVIVWLCSVVLAWPLAELYGDPRLMLMIPIGSTAVLLQGLTSPTLFTLHRELQVARLTALEFGAQALGIAVMLVWALLAPSVWVMVASLIVSTGFKTVGSHLMSIGHSVRFENEPEARREIFAFGRWILGSSALTFFGRQGDRLMLGVYLGVAPLGIYSIAAALSEAVGVLVMRITRRILFPVMSRVREEGTDSLREVFYRSRLGLDMAIMPGLGILALSGHYLIELLYDPRYAAAGWMLELLAIRVAMSCVALPSEMCLVALGHPRYSLYQNAARLVWVAGGIALGHHFFGLAGVLWAIALSELPSIAIQWAGLWRARILVPRLEARSFALFAAGAAAGALVRMLFDRLLHAT